MLLNTYQANIRKYSEAVAGFTRLLGNLSMFRLAVFLITAILVTVLATQREFMLAWLLALIGMVSFAALVKRYNQVENEKQHHDFLRQINTQEVSRLDNKLEELPASPVQADRDHPYAGDLDIFGAHALFKLINRATTQAGQSLLAGWLMAPAARQEILARQQAVKDLAPRLEWRQHFQAGGMRYGHTKNDFDQLLAWINAPARLLPNRWRYLAAVVPLTIASTVAAVYFFSNIHSVTDVEDMAPLLLPLAIVSTINILVLRTTKEAVEAITENIGQHAKILGALQALIQRIEPEQFQSPRLTQLQAVFVHQQYAATQQIARLKRVLEVLQVKGRKREFNNAFYAAFNTLWFLDIHLVTSAEQWKEKNRAYVHTWSAAVSEFEALNSLAGFHYSNPAYAFADISTEPYVIRFENLGHPLLAAKNRVCNDFQFTGRGQIAMITGSNMAGKSTFLRTIGINLVLAQMGAPCCATAARVSTMKVFTSMRTQDNLEEGVSSFYAELKRIEQLLKLVEGGEDLFFMLDEMFKGTNSQDRYKGGVSLIRQLNALNAFGLISTHDLELARLNGNNLDVVNYNFHSTIEQGELIFNYKLTPGICQDFNASELMRRSGIKILPELG